MNRVGNTICSYMACCAMASEVRPNSSARAATQCPCTFERLLFTSPRQRTRLQRNFLTICNWPPWTFTNAGVPNAATAQLQSIDGPGTRSAGRIRRVSLVDRTSRSSRGVRFGVFDVVSPRRDTLRRERIARADGGKVHGRAEEDAAAQIGWIGSLTERRRCFGTSSWRGTSSWSLDSSGGN